MHGKVTNTQKFTLFPSCTLSPIYISASIFLSWLEKKWQLDSDGATQQKKILF